MQKIYTLLLVLLCTFLCAQQEPVNPQRWEVSRDSYGDLYVYSRDRFDLTKYDSIGRQLGRQLFTNPYRIQSFQNPLRIPAFSAAAQRLIFLDQYLNLIQSFPTESYGWVAAVNVADHQHAWMLETTQNRLLFVDFRQEKILKTYVLPFDSAQLTDLMVADENLYFLSNHEVIRWQVAGEVFRVLHRKEGAPLIRLWSGSGGKIFLEDRDGNYYEWAYPTLKKLLNADRITGVFDGENYYYQENGRWRVLPAATAQTDSAPNFEVTR